MSQKHNNPQANLVQQRLIVQKLWSSNMRIIFAATKIVVNNFSHAYRLISQCIQQQQRHRR